MPVEGIYCKNQGACFSLSAYGAGSNCGGMGAGNIIANTLIVAKCVYDLVNSGEAIFRTG
jgi:hypothetical protein